MEANRILYQNGVYIKEKVVKVINNQKKKLDEKNKEIEEKGTT